MPVGACVATVVRQRTGVETGGIKGGTPLLAELNDALEVRQNPSGLRSVCVWILALVAGDRPEHRVAVSRADVGKSPNAGSYSILQKRLLLEVLGGDTAQVLRMLKQAAHKEASQARRCNSTNDANGKWTNSLPASARRR